MKIIATLVTATVARVLIMTTHGDYVYFRHGAFGKAYLLQNRADCEALRKALQRVHSIEWTVTVITLVVSLMIKSVYPFVILIIPLRRYILRQTYNRVLPGAQLLSYRETLSHFAKSTSWNSVTAFSVGILLGFGGLLVLYLHCPVPPLFIGFMSVVFTYYACISTSITYLKIQDCSFLWLGPTREELRAKPSNKGLETDLRPARFARRSCALSLFVRQMIPISCIK